MRTYVQLDGPAQWEVRPDLPGPQGPPWYVSQRAYLMPAWRPMELAVLVETQDAAWHWSAPQVVGYRFRYARNTRSAFRYPRAFAEVQR